jgi:hypothetical protein
MENLNSQGFFERKVRNLLTWFLVQESAVNATDTDTVAAKLKEVT